MNLGPAAVLIASGRLTTYIAPPQGRRRPFASPRPHLPGPAGQRRARPSHLISSA